MFFRARKPLRFDPGLSTVGLAILVAGFAVAVIALIALLGGGSETVASRSAAAFEEAQRKGIPVGQGAHGHGAVSPGGAASHHPADTSDADHAGHGGAEPPHRAETGTPSHAGHATTGAAAGGGSPHAGTHHGTSAPVSGAAASPHSGMHHGTVAGAPAAGGAAGHVGHGGPPQAPVSTTASAPPEPLPKAAVAGPGQPAATLEPDPVDAPAETSVLDAKRSAELAREMGSGGHGMMHGTGSYRQLDAGRESAPTGQPTAAPHQHGTSPGSMPAPDTKKPRPAVTPVPTPGAHVHPGGGHR